MRTRHGTSGGFTLLEVLLAMILLVLLAGAAVFAFSGWQTRAALSRITVPRHRATSRMGMGRSRPPSGRKIQRVHRARPSSPMTTSPKSAQ